MTKMFSSPKMPDPSPAPDPLPAAPTRSDAQTTALAEEQRRRFSGAKGRASTFLTGAGTTATSNAVRFLGNAAST